MQHGYPQWWHVYYAVRTDLVQFQKRHNADITYCSFGAIASLSHTHTHSCSLCIQTKCVCFGFWMRLKINFNSNKSQSDYGNILTLLHCAQRANGFSIWCNIFLLKWKSIDVDSANCKFCWHLLRCKLKEFVFHWPKPWYGESSMSLRSMKKKEDVWYFFLSIKAVGSNSQFKYSEFRFSNRFRQVSGIRWCDIRHKKKNKWLLCKQGFIQSLNQQCTTFQCQCIHCMRYACRLCRI